MIGPFFLFILCGSFVRSLSLQPFEPVTFSILHGECNPSPVPSSELFEEEVSDIAQVLCESELFEFELTDLSPLVNVKGNP